LNRYLRAIGVLVAAAAFVGVILAVLLPADDFDIDTVELEKRVDRARVTWADYGEGIKAELGATPAAHWHGAPAEARLVDGAIEVRFALRPPWSDYEFGMPILLRDPEGNVFSPDEFTKGGTYAFRHTGPVTPLSVPWVELRYPPNEERRIVFDTAGQWRAAER
jgi:hypothetical protein